MTDTAPSPRRGPSRVEVWIAIVIVAGASFGLATLVYQAPWSSPSDNNSSTPEPNSTATEGPTGVDSIDDLVDEIEAIERERWSIKLAAMRHEVDHAILSYEIEDAHTTGLSATDVDWLAAYRRRKATIREHKAELETFTFTVLNRRELDPYNTLLLLETTSYEFDQLDDETTPASYGAQVPLKYTRPSSVLATRIDGRWFIGRAPSPDANGGAAANSANNANSATNGNTNVPTDRGEQLRLMRELAAELGRLTNQLRGYHDAATRALTAGDDDAFQTAAVDGYTSCYRALTAWHRVRLLAHRLSQSIDPTWRQDADEAEAMLAVFDSVEPPSGTNPRTDERVLQARQQYEQALDDAQGAIGD